MIFILLSSTELIKLQSSCNLQSEPVPKLPRDIAIHSGQEEKETEAKRLRWGKRIKGKKAKGRFLERTSLLPISLLRAPYFSHSLLS